MGGQNGGQAQPNHRCEWDGLVAEELSTNDLEETLRHRGCMAGSYIRMIYGATNGMEEGEAGLLSGCGEGNLNLFRVSQ
ncbi:MAG: hypothetical protein NVS9B15_01380 [Acidobacteriaceae bacterium]